MAKIQQKPCTWRATMYRYSNGQISLPDFGHESEGKQPLGKESPDDPLAGDREALRRPIHKPERQCGPAAASGLGGLHHSGGVWFLI